MTHFRSDSHRDRRGGMNGELRAAHTTAAKRGNSAPDRVFDYQRVPSSVPVDPSPVKRPRPSSSSSSSSTAAALRMKSRRASDRSINRRASSSSSSSELKMAELLSIKRELTEVKLQLDGLLACVEQMDRQRKDCTVCPQVQDSTMSPHRGSVSSLESPEPGEASEDEPVHYQHYYPHRIKHQSDLEDDL